MMKSMLAQTMDDDKIAAHPCAAHPQDLLATLVAPTIISYLD
jgi:hypothetical protein